MNIAGLQAQIEAAYDNGEDVALAWVVIKDFDINKRYPLGYPFPKRTASDYVEAIGELGLIAWLTNGII